MKAQQDGVHLLVNLFSFLLHNSAFLTRLRDISARTIALDVLLIAVLNRAAFIRFHARYAKAGG